MNYQRWDLGWVKAGTVVTVDLSGTECNVLLLTPSNFNKFHRGQAYEYYGGHFKKSPVQLDVPFAGQWVVVINLGGFSGSVSARVTYKEPVN